MNVYKILVKVNSFDLVLTSVCRW